MVLTKDRYTCLIAQIFPYFGKVLLRNTYVLTCDGQKDALGGILAFRAKGFFLDNTSKIEMSGKGNLRLDKRNIYWLSINSPSAGLMSDPLYPAFRGPVSWEWMLAGFLHFNHCMQ